MVEDEEQDELPNFEFRALGRGEIGAAGGNRIEFRENDGDLVMIAGDKERLRIGDSEISFDGGAVVINGVKLDELLSDLWAAIEQLRIDLERLGEKIDESKKEKKA